MTLLFVVLVSGILGILGYEAFTGHFWSTRMEFATDQLVKLSDPDLKKNIEGDQELEQVHASLKGELNQFLAGTNYNLGVPEYVLKALAAAFPWLLLTLVLFVATEREQFAKVLVGMLVAAVPFIVLGAFIPSLTNWWINYILYPFGSTIFAVAAIVMWQRVRRVSA